jgi:hypothetical protein
MKQLDELFKIRNGNGLELISCTEVHDGICFVSRTSRNNGVVARVELLDDVEPMPANAITVALSGSVLASFFQPEPFYTAFHIACLYPKQELTIEQMLYYASIIERNKYRYSFGRQANRTLKDILIPDINELPDYINGLSVSNYKFAENPLIDKQIALNTDNWEWFRYEEIFEIKKGKRLTKANMIEGSINYVGATKFNNGITIKIGNKEHLHSPNTITVSYNGSIAEAFYQIEPFWATDDVNVLYPKFELNAFIAMFLCTLIHAEKYRFNYGLKWEKEKMLVSKIKLPVTPSGTPDWQLMEDYIKSLPYSKSIQLQNKQ